MIDEKIGLIYQPCGLGDILFLQKLAHYIDSLGYKVYWPVIPEFSWLKNYIKCFNFISWDDLPNKITKPPLPSHVEFPFKEKYLSENKTEITNELFFFQGFINVNPIMAGKYNSINLDWSDWNDYVLFDRNYEKENILYYDVLNLKDNESYIFANANYCMRPHPMRFNGIDEVINNANIKVIELEIISGFSLFDWCKVIENAREIHMIETSLNYILESPNLFNTVKSKQLSLYHRQGFFNEVDYLFKLPWNYIS